MEKIKKTLEEGFKNGFDVTTNTPEFTNFARYFKKTVTKILEDLNCTNITFHTGYFTLHFCFTQRENGQTWYGALSDVRHGTMCKLFIRRTKSYKDYVGEHNITIYEIENFKTELERNLNWYKNNRPLYK